MLDILMLRLKQMILSKQKIHLMFLAKPEMNLNLNDSKILILKLITSGERPNFSEVNIITIIDVNKLKINIFSQ